jgi:hypothetical protein
MRSNFAVIRRGLAATESNRFENDSETAVNQIDVAHIGVPEFGFSRREIGAVNTIHVGPAAIRLQQPKVFVTKTFFDPDLLLWLRAACVPKFRYRA